MDVVSRCGGGVCGANMREWGESWREMGWFRAVVVASGWWTGVSLTAGGVEWKTSEELEGRGVEDWLEVTFAESETMLICYGGPEGKWPDLRQILLGKCKGRHRYFTERSRRKMNKKYIEESVMALRFMSETCSPHLRIMKLYEVGKLFRIVFCFSCLWGIKFKITDSIWLPWLVIKTSNYLGKMCDIYICVKCFNRTSRFSCAVFPRTWSLEL